MSKYGYDRNGKPLTVYQATYGAGERAGEQIGYSKAMGDTMQIIASCPSSSSGSGAIGIALIGAAIGLGAALLGGLFD